MRLKKALIIDGKSFITKKDAIIYLLKYKGYLSYKEISIITYSSISYIKLIKSLNRYNGKLK